MANDPTNPSKYKREKAQEAIDSLPMTALYMLSDITSPAKQEDVDTVFDGKHSDWTWIRLPNGDLVLAVYPQEDTYFEVVDSTGI